MTKVLIYYAEGRTVRRGPVRKVARVGRVLERHSNRRSSAITVLTAHKEHVRKLGVDRAISTMSAAMIRIATGGPTCPDRMPIIITPTGPVPMHMVTIPITRDRAAGGASVRINVV